MELNITVNVMLVIGTSEMGVRNDKNQSLDVSEQCYIISDCFRVFTNELN